MPRMDQDDIEDDSGSLAKVLLIGDGKIGKTWWAAQAASEGFNVLYFDGDVGRPTIKQLPKETRKRIYAIDAADSMGGGRKDSKFLDVLSEFSDNVVFSWNDSKQRIAKASDTGDVIWKLKPAKMDETCVFIMDSWTAFGESAITSSAITHGVDVRNASQPEMRPVYATSGMKSMAMLQVIRSMRCHVIVIAHPDEYSHMTKPDGVKVGSVAEKEMVIDWTKLIPKSTSKPNAMQMAKYFTDILWVETNATGSQRLINARLDPDRMSGGHWNDRKSFVEYSFGNLVRHLGGRTPGDAGAPIDSWLQIVEPLRTDSDSGAEARQQESDSPMGQSHSVILDGSKPTELIQTPTMKNLFAKRAPAAA